MTQNAGNLIALIETFNEGRASHFSDDNFRELDSRLHLHEDALALLIKLFLNLGLCNGSQGAVKEISYVEWETSPSLPKLALADFGTSRARDFFS